MLDRDPKEASGIFRGYPRNTQGMPRGFPGAFIRFPVVFRELGVWFRLESYLLIVNAKNVKSFLCLSYIGRFKNIK